MKLTGEKISRKRIKEKEFHRRERVRNAVRATGNKWAIENFNATH